ncbi:amidase [Metallibacterium sp.]|uniref:amidase n=1 Tax=Metallibacterium sp. TaxID=2940281 RepID=UPI0026017BC6|nr:amidase [Metallibacterium sp.]
MRHRFATLPLTLIALLPFAAAQGAEKSTPHATPLYDASVAQLEARMRAGTLSAVQLTQMFLKRIAAIDRAGPKLNSIIELNPDALREARRIDAARRAGKPLGPLAGIPVLLKDNIDTGDKMMTTAGSLALVGAPAATDAPLVARLRAAGAVILGKTNLSEWANYRSNHSSSGWSGRGGLTRNPYVLDRTACGSSSGSAVAVSAGLTTLAVGTETDGSLICPGSMNGIVAIKPTLGLISRTGIVPIAHSQDTAGPMARDVADAAALLTVMAGTDPADPATKDANLHKVDYTKFLKADGLKGKRIGVVRAFADGNPAVLRVLDAAVAALRKAGAIVIDPVVIPHVDAYGKDENLTLSYEFKADLNAYLATRHGIPVKTLADVIAFNKAHAAQEMPWFGQSLMIKSEARGPLTDPRYLKALAAAKRLSGPEGIDAALKKDHLDALMAPSNSPAWVIDLVNGDRGGVSSSSPAAVAGYPDITVPAGFVHGLPLGVSFFGAKWSEPTLIEIAYGFEQATHARRDPEFLKHAPI